MTDINEKAIAIIEKSLAPLLHKAAQITITTQSAQDQAGEMLTQINRYADAMDKEKRGATDPLNASLKKIRGWFAPRETVITAAVQSLRTAMSRYQLEADKRTRVEADRLAARVEKGTMKAETAVRKMGEIAQPADQVETSGGGSVKFRTVKKLVVTDDTSLKTWLVKNRPDLLEYNERSVLDIIKGGLPVLGAHAEDSKEIVNSR